MLLGCVNPPVRVGSGFVSYPMPPPGQVLEGGVGDSGLVRLPEASQVGVGLTTLWLLLVLLLLRLLLVWLLGVSLLRALRFVACRCLRRGCLWCRWFRWFCCFCSCCVCEGFASVC